MKNRAFRKFVASIGVAAMVMSTATNALSPAVTKAESAQELEGQQNDSQEQGGQEDPVAQSSDDANGAPFADAEPMAVSSDDSQNSQEAAGPSESSDSNGENGAEGSSGENTNASAGSTSTDASGAESQGAAGTISGATNGTSANGTSANTSTGAANGTSADASTGTTTGENGEASGDNAEASTKEITSVITEDIDLGTYPAGEAPAYAQLELPDEIEVKVDEEKQIVTVTWNGEETYHPDQAGTYIFSSELDKEWNKDENGNARYQLAEKAELPKASVRVEKKAESKEENKTDVKSDNKTENKTDAKLDNKTDSKTDAKADNKKDSKTDAKADNKSEGKTEEKSDNKSEVTTKPETTKETTKDTSKENTKETSKKDSASKDKTKDETKNETKGEAKNEAKEENKTDTKDETAKADQKKKVTNAASLKAVYVAEDGTILCGTVGLTGDSFTISDKTKNFNGYELKTVTLGEEELPQDTAFTRNTSTTETKEEIRTEASYTYTMDGAEHEIAAGDTATITFTYAQKEEVTPEIASIEVTGEAVDTTGAAIQGDYAFPLAVGTNDLSKTAPYIQGYEYQYAEIGTDKITSIDKEVLEAGKYAYYVDGELLKENTKITYVYQEDEDYTEQLSADCGEVSVTLSATKDAKIPKNAKLVVNAITGDRLRSALSMSADAMGVTADKVYGTAYDIYLEADGNRIQPSEHVHVTMSFHNPVSLNLPDKAQVAKSAVIHIHDGSASEVSGTADTDGSSVTGAEFDADSFSIYVNAYTVDFHYNGLTYSMKGNGAVKLSEVMKAVDIQKDVAEVKSAIFTNPKLLKVEKDTEGNDWTLTSLQSFTSDEILTVTMEDGTVYAIAVTDDQESTTSNQLSDFVTSMTIKVDGEDFDENKKYTSTQDYEFNLIFEEKINSDGKVEKKIEQIVYMQMPDALVHYEGSGTLSDPNEQTVGNYTIDRNGKVTIIFTDAFMQKAEQGKVSGNFKFHSNLSVSQGQESVKVTIPGGNISKTINIDTKAHLNADKKVEYNDEAGLDGLLKYTVTLTASNGNVVDVNIVDTLGSDLVPYPSEDDFSYQIVYSPDSIGEENGTFNQEENSWTTKLGEIKNGQTATLTYYAKLSEDAKAKLRRGESITAANNSVSATGNNKETISNSPNADLTNKFNYKKEQKATIKKEIGEGYDKTKQTIEWKLTVNEGQMTCVKGQTVTDTLDKGSYKKGDVINVTRSDGAEFTISMPDDGKSWSYKFGENPKDFYDEGSDKTYQYIFTYVSHTDDVDRDALNGATVKNEGKIGDITDSAEQTIPGEGKKPEKEAAGITKDKASWKITVHVPKEGLTGFYIQDTTVGIPTKVNGEGEGISDWHAYMEIDQSSIQVSRSDRGEIPRQILVTNYYVPDKQYQPTNYFFFGQDVSKTAQIEENKSLSALPASEGGYDLIITYETFNKAQESDKDQPTDAAPGSKVNNTITGGFGSITAQQVVPVGKQPPTIKKIQPGSYGYGNGWNGYFNVGKQYDTGNGCFNYCILLDCGLDASDKWSPQGLGNGNITIVDTYSNNLKYVAGSAYLASYDGFSKYGDIRDFSAQGVKEIDPVSTDIKAGEENSSLTFVIDSDDVSKKYCYAVFYQLELKDKSLWTSSEGIQLNNSATVSTADDNNLSAGNVSYTYKNPPIEKYIEEANKNNKYVAKYKITVPCKEEFLTDGKLIIIDRSSNLAIDDSTFQIRDNDSNRVLEKNEYSRSGESETTITIKSPISGHKYEITYEAKVTGAVGKEIEYTNSAYIAGKDTYTATVDRKVTKEQLAAGNVDVHSFEFSLYKYAADTKNSLSGAVFEILNKDKTIVLGEYTTGEDGKVAVKAFDHGYLITRYVQYVLREKTAPEGYQKCADISFYLVDDTKSEDEIQGLGLTGTRIYNKQPIEVEDKVQPKPTTASIEAVKTLTGRNLKAEEFEFSLTPKTEGDTNKAQTVKNGADGSIRFAALSYKAAGTYEYEIAETSESKDGVTADTTTYTAKVTVTDNGAGKLVATVSYIGLKDNESKPTFRNTYTATEATASIEAVKTLTGRNLKAEEFEFSLTPKTEGDTNKAQTVKNGADGSIRFAALSYKAAGTYEYEIAETSESKDGVTADTTTYTAKVTVTDNGAGKLVATVSYIGLKGNESKPTFRNTYTATEATASIEAVKTLTGRNLKAEEFEFSLTPKTEGDTNKAQTVKNGADGSIRFAALSYKAVGTYEYEIAETSESKDGVTADTTTYTAKVTVTDNGAGKLVATVSYIGLKDNESKPTFRNTYTATEATASIEAVKTLTGRNLKAEEFEFSLTPKTEGDTNKAQTVKNGADGSIRFAALSYKAAGTYEYEIAETSESKDGVTADTTTYTAKVTVTDNGAGKLVATVSYIGLKDNESKPTFRNTYTATEATASIEAVKTLTGRNLKAEEFEFSLTPKTEGDTNKAQTVKNGADGSIRFAALSYKAAGTYEYEIAETSESKDGVTADTTTYTAKVTVTDNGAGKLVATVSYIGLKGNESKPTFRNTYTATEATASIEAVKTLTGRNLKAEEFEFSLTPKTEGDTNKAQTVKNGADGSIRFAALSYKAAGTYEYEIAETSESKDGVTADTTTYTAKVTVTDNGAGKLVATVSYIGLKDNESKPTFRNTYTATEATASIEAVKTLTGRNLKAEEFEFSLTPKTEGDTNKAQTVKNGADGSIRFAALSYKAAGTYEYEIAETSESKDGVTADTTTYTAKVTVTDNGAGKLVATVSYIGLKDNESKPTFRNTYTATEATASIEAVKTLTGRNLKAEEFEFSLTPKTEGDTNKAQTVKNGADGSIRFAALSYKAAGTYEYEIAETSESKDGVTADTTTYTAKVTVTDNGAGKLVATVSYIGLKDNESKPTFRNTYTATEATASIEAVKTLTGRNLKAEEFEFSLTPKTEGDTNKAQTVKNGADGSIRFAALSYKAAGTYEYEIAETSESKDGVTADTTTYTAKVTVTDNGAGKLVATVSYIGLKDNESKPTFRNTYTATEATASIEAVKTLTGRNLKAEEFEFSLTPKTEGDTNKAQTVKNGADGSIRFAALSYKAAGTYEYEIAETSESKDGVTADTTTYTAKVTVTDNGAGKLVATVSYIGLKDNESKPTFRNTYTATEATASIEAVKTLTGRNLKAEEFEFSLTPKTEGDTNKAQTVKNGADGSIRFAALSYKAAGTYEYEIAETSESKDGITADTTTYTAKVTVTDNGAGKLVATVSYIGLKDNESKPTFRNTYTATEATASIEAVKTLTGRNLKAEEFEFSLTPKTEGDTNKAQTVKNGADGSIRFAALSYKAAGTYEYEIAETSESKDGVTADTTTYTAKVTVTDDGAGKLVATVSYIGLKDNESKPTFRNTYTATEATASIEAVKTLTGRNLKAEEFEFSLTPKTEGDTNKAQTVKNGADGSIRFAALSYKAAGTYEYEIAETSGNDTRITYDQTVYHVKVEVTDDKVGHLQAKVNCEGSTGVMNLNFTNHYDVVTVPVAKSWSDDNNRDNKRPSSITVNLFADGTKIASQKITAADGWKYEFKDLPKYNNGTEIKYTITEDAVDGYTSSINGYNITNTYTPEKVQVSGSKNWNDDGNAAGTRPGSITIRLYANGSEIGHKTVTEKDGWSWNWTGLNRYDTDHKEISYTISEDAVDGYTSSISGYNVTNTVNKPQVGSVILTKVDATTGTALAGAVFDLYRANNTKVGTYTTNAGGVLRVDGLTFGDYYFVETKAPEGYALESQRAAFTINAATTVSAPASVRVTNKPVDEKIGVSAVKVWDDENNTDGVRPSSVTFRLFADGVEIGSAQASEANGWTVSFGNLPKTRNGVAISYAVKEDEVGNYYEASYETGLGSDGSYVFTVKNYRETDKHYEERTGSVRGANRNKPSNGGVAGAGRGRGTGDESDMTVYGTVSGASLLALIVWMIARRKRAGKGTK